MERIVNIDGKELKMRASALVPKLYRFHFGRDIIQDMKDLAEAYKKNQADGTPFELKDLGVFENVAWLFLKLGGEDVGTTADEWLDSLDSVFSVYEVMPTILELWSGNLVQTSKPKKK